MAESALSDSDIESLRCHLGYGNLGTGVYPYTEDGFQELFNDVIAPNLTTGQETSATTAITADATTTVTPVSMTGIAVYVRLVVDVGDDAEIVQVRSLPSGSTFSAKFAKAHPATGYPIAVLSGVSRLRLLLHSADKAWQAVQSEDITGNAGLKSVGRGAVEWFEGGRVLTETAQHYARIVQEISNLVLVQPRGRDAGCSTRIEAY